MIWILLKCHLYSGRVTHSFNSCIWETEAERPGTDHQPMLHETLSKKKVDSTWCSHACYVLCLSLWATVSCSTACFLSPAFLSSPECWDDKGHHLWLLAQLLLSVFQPFCCMPVSCIKYRVESLFFDQVCYLTGSINIHIFCKHLTRLQYFILFTFAHVLCTS